MSPTPTQRRLFLGVALAATVAVVFGQGSAPPETMVVAAVKPAATSRIEGQAPRRLEVERLARAPANDAAPDLFAPKSWRPPRPAPRPAATPPPPMPVAPPLPFEYVGQMEGKEGVVAYLAREGDFLTVKAGERLGADYRLESISPEALEFTYLPLGERQTLAAVKKDEP